MILDSPGPNCSDDNKPTRCNILKSIRWLINDTKPGDCILFYYSGYSVQIDDLSGWEGEGYDEAYVPIDYMDYGDPGNGIIPCIQIRKMLQSVNKYCQVLIILDTCGLQTTLDTIGYMNIWGYIKGSKLKGIWPLINTSGKLKKANYNSIIWNDINMHNQFVKQKFIPILDVDCVSNLLNYYLLSNYNITSTPTSNIICIAAAPWDNVALESLFKPIILKDLPNVVRKVTTKEELSTSEVRDVPSETRREFSPNVMRKENSSRNEEISSKKEFSTASKMKTTSSTTLSSSCRQPPPFTSPSASLRSAAGSTRGPVLDFIPLEVTSNTSLEPSSIIPMMDDPSLPSSDIVVCHGVFTYSLIQTILHDKSTNNNITIRNLISGINNRISYLKNTRLPKLNQVAEATIHPSSLASLDDLFTIPHGYTPEFKQKKISKLQNGPQSFLNLNDAWLQLHYQGRIKANQHKEKFHKIKSYTQQIQNHNNHKTIVNTNNLYLGLFIDDNNPLEVHSTRGPITPLEVRSTLSSSCRQLF